MTRCDQTPAWAALQAAFDAGANRFDLRTAFVADAQRFERFSQSAPHVFADLSKNLLDADTEALLMDLARQCGVQEHRDAMFAGDTVNNTENRAVMHWLLRNPPLTPVNSAQAAPNFIASCNIRRR
jgi:glucose-6-phosphate isomerase